jgi:hypothetical protein
MSTNDASYGLLVFLGDWVRFKSLRDRFFDAEIPFHKFAEQIRVDYQLTDDDIGALARADKPTLIKRLRRVVEAVDLDLPPAWTGAPPPRGNGGGEEGVGWPGEPLVCLESVSRGGKASAAIAANNEVTLTFLGWNLDKRTNLQFVHPKADPIPITTAFKTDRIGRSKGTAKVTFPKSGKWTVELVDARDSRGALVNAVTVKKS